METTKYSSDSALNALGDLLHRLFGPNAGHVLPIVLAALTSRTGHPICARTVGNGRTHRQIGPLVEQLLGEKALHITGVTDTGLLALGNSDSCRTLVYEGNLDIRETREILFRLILHLAVRHLDAPGGIEPRIRHLDGPFTVILIACDQIDDRELASAMVTVLMTDYPAAIRHETELKLASLNQDSDGDFPNVADVRDHLNSIQWKTPVVFDQATELVASIMDCNDANRVEQLLALTRVFVLLSRPPCPEDTSIHATTADLEAVIEILDMAGVDDDRQHLSAGALTFLQLLQDYERKKISQGEQNSLGSDGRNASRGVRFSRYDLTEWNQFAGLKGSLIESRLKTLETAGMIERAGKDGRRLRWHLTQWGRNYRRRSLAELLRGWQSDLNSSQLQETSDHGPTEIKLPAHGK